MNKVYLLIGGNMGDRLANLQAALILIEKEAGEIVLQSSIYETEAWGLKEQPAFLNQAVLIESQLSATTLLSILQKIEQSLGRKREIPLGPRTMDIDIIYFNDIVLSENNLTIPHPSLQERNFVLIPLVEIAPLFMHPQLQLTNSQLLAICKDPSTVYKKI
jgi:2-amino-4-hydroxy-6-hydroxymethyldihydropteridine diphosphokinase